MNLREQKGVTDVARAGVDVAQTVLFTLDSAIVQAGPTEERDTTGNIPGRGSSEDDQRLHTADGGATCKHMTNGVRQFLMAACKKNETVPLLLELLIENPGQSASDLAKVTGIRRANISHKLNELAAAGLVEKELCLRSSPLYLEGGDPKHNSKRGRKEVIFSAYVPTTHAKRAVWVTHFERRYRKHAPAHVGQDECTAFELLVEAGLDMREAKALATARASIDPDKHHQSVERRIQKRLSHLQRALKDTSLAAVIPTTDLKAYTLACMKEHFAAVPLAKKAEHALALGVSVDNFNDCIRRHGFRPNATMIVETFRAGDLGQKLPALRRQHLARVIACRGEFGEVLHMPTDEEIERVFRPDEQVTVHLRGVNTYPYTGECQSPKPRARTVVPAMQIDHDLTDVDPEVRRVDSPATRRFRKQFGPYVRMVDDETGVLEKAPIDMPLLLMCRAWADGTLRVRKSELREG